MNSKMTTNLQLSTTELKKQKQAKQTTRTGTESQKQRSHRGLSEGRGSGEIGGKGTGNKKHKWQIQNRQEEVKNSIGNGEAKELICMTHGHELRWGNYWWEGSAGQKGINGRKQWDNCNRIINEIYYKN